MAAPLQLVLTVCGVAFVGLLLGLAVLLLLQTIVACVSRGRIEAPSGSVRPRVAVLIPAHDEAGGIAATLASIVPQLATGDRVVVIADNCSDDTAAVATALGVTVVERTDTTRRGKGYALDYGIGTLAADAPDVVLMFDADCIAGPGCVGILAVEAERLRRPVQALYLIRASNDSVVSRLSEFAQRMRNWVRPLGMRRLGLPCQLMGSGMGFHWSLLQRQSVASGHLTEDLQLGLAFARQRSYPQFCPGASVDSQSVADPAGAAVQRTRWEHGHLGTIVAEWPPTAARSIARLDVRLAFMAWDLAVPPLALYASTLVVASVAFVGVGLAWGVWWPASCLAVAMLMLFVTIGLAQRGFARDLIRLREIFLSVPLYLLRKAPVYFRFLFRRQVEWIRTKRDVG